MSFVGIASVSFVVNLSDVNFPSFGNVQLSALFVFFGFRNVMVLQFVCLLLHT